MYISSYLEQPVGQAYASENMPRTSLFPLHAQDSAQSKDDAALLRAAGVSSSNIGAVSNAIDFILCGVEPSTKGSTSFQKNKTQSSRRYDKNALSSGPAYTVSLSTDSRSSALGGLATNSANSVRSTTQGYGADMLPRNGLSGTHAVSSGRVPTDAEIQAEEARVLRQLEQRDNAVRSKEAAQGEAVTGESYMYQTGPDGKKYAVGTSAHLVKPAPEPGSAEDQASAPVGQDGQKLSRGEQEQLRELQERDAHVRQHEAAHIMAGGGQVSASATYEYQTGPDGKRYAVGGSVQVAVSQAAVDEDDMERQATAAHRAAMATGDPSAADMQVAQKALSNVMKAKMQKYEKANESDFTDRLPDAFVGAV